MSAGNSGLKKWQDTQDLSELVIIETIIYLYLFIKSQKKKI